MLTTRTWIAALVFFAPVSALAQNVSPKDPKALAEAMEAQGWPAKLSTPADENPVIQTNRDGVKALVMLMNCNDKHKDCRSIQFYMGFNDAKQTTLERLNEWNRTKRFGRVYRDQDGDPVMEMDVDMDHDGIPRAVFNEYLLTWAELMTKFRDHINAK